MLELMSQFDPRPGLGPQRAPQLYEMMDPLQARRHQWFADVGIGTTNQNKLSMGCSPWSGRNDENARGSSGLARRRSSNKMGTG